MTIRNGMSLGEAGKKGRLVIQKIWEEKNKQRLEEYNKNPVLCKFCNKKIPFEKRRWNKFCGHTCSASYNNSRRENVEHKGNFRKSPIWSIKEEDFKNAIRDNKTVSNVLVSLNLRHTANFRRLLKIRCKAENIDISHLNLDKNYQRPLREVMIENSSYDRGKLKYRLIKNKLIENKCAICGQLTEWKGKKLVLVLDHINGVRNDHRKENLRLLCPNCNSQTDTFCGKNMKK